jgi:hypothetical protein
LTRTISPSETHSQTRAITPPLDQLTSAERAAVLALVRAIGLCATRRALGVGTWSLDRLVYLSRDNRPFYRLRPSIVRRVRERLSVRHLLPANDDGVAR